MQNPINKLLPGQNILYHSNKWATTKCEVKHDINR